MPIENLAPLKFSKKILPSLRATGGYAAIAVISIEFAQSAVVAYLLIMCLTLHAPNTKQEAFHHFITKFKFHVRKPSPELGDAPVVQ